MRDTSHNFKSSITKEITSRLVSFVDPFRWTFQKSSYVFNKMNVTKLEAVRFCRSIGAQLVRIDTMEEFSYLQSKLISESKQ